MGFEWNLIFFSFVREREGYKHHADCTVPLAFSLGTGADKCNVGSFSLYCMRCFKIIGHCFGEDTCSLLF